MSRARRDYDSPTSSSTIEEGPMEVACRQVKSYCGLCSVHCPVLVAVDGQQVVSVRPDSCHPHGGAICAKGRAAPELHVHPDRVNVPLRRTRPKTDPDPGWERISWDEALDLIARKMLDVRARSGAQAVAFNLGTKGGTGIFDAYPWIHRLANTFGTPNVAGTTHLCQWPRDTGASFYTFGIDWLPMPQVAQSGCILLWGVNPSANYLNLVQGVVEAEARGARLIVVDPRRVGLANKADLLLQVRPGTDGALALSLIHLLLADNLFDEGFVREWTNAPLLVRDDTEQLLRVEDLVGDEGQSDDRPRYLAACRGSEAELIPYDPRRGRYDVDPSELDLWGSRAVRLASGDRVGCRSVFARLDALARAYPPRVAADITGVPADTIVAAARMLAEHRPVSHYFHNGLVQHTNATQASRAIAVLYALLGDWDRPGGNVIPQSARVNAVMGRTALPEEMDAIRLGRRERPIGPPAKSGSVAAYDLYDAILDGRPYPVRALLAFGGNMLLANGDTLRGREALRRLEFFAQVELVHTPTSAFADVLLPAATFLESRALKTGQAFPLEGAARIQRRDPAVEPLYERRSDVDIVFDLACRLGLAEHFWGGDVEAGYDFVLQPSGLTWHDLGEFPHGVEAPRGPLRYQKHAQMKADTGAPAGFNTPTGKVELFAVPFAAHGYAPLPAYVEPAHSPRSAPELAERYPLVMTNAKKPQYLHSQHRGLPSIRKTAPDPTAELHPETAAKYGVAHGEWIAIETPSGSARARAQLTDTILPGVLCASHGWWQGCEELGIPPLDPYSSEGANVNLLVRNDLRDPISGGVPHRSTLCRVRSLEGVNA
jgi:anaerobic selenocysteine-containing dehydrogenase